MSVRILIAGCLPRDRGQIEGEVRKAFQTLPETDPWNVSLVKLGATWSISMEGPDVNNFGLSAPEDRLRETIAEALGTNGIAKKKLPTLEELEAADGLTSEAVAPPVVANRATDQSDRYECHGCKQSFKVVYVPDSSDRKVKAPIACPSCWEITEVTIPESAASTEQYQAELDG